MKNSSLLIAAAVFAVLLVIAIVLIINWGRLFGRDDVNSIVTPTPTIIIPTTTPTPTPLPITPSISQAPVGIDIRDYAFNPQTVTIDRGTTIVWTNRDSVAHTVTIKGRPLVSSNNLSNGDSFSYTFQNPGTYEYYCSIHPSMTGTVIVR